MESRYPQNKLTIIGGGIIGAFQVYYAFLEAKKSGRQIRITLHEKNPSLLQTTTSHLVPSLTPVEPVLPSPAELLDRLSIPFTEQNGLQVNDVPEIDSSAATCHFLNQVKKSASDEAGYLDRTRVLMEMGVASMQLWQDIYTNADERLKQIFTESNFNPCHENSDNTLHNGYRISLMYNTPDASKLAGKHVEKFHALGYVHCQLLSPDEMLEIDPFLEYFVATQSVTDTFGKRQWKDNVAAVWHPAGCIDTNIFLPKFYDYLQEEMGTYVNNNGVRKNCFQIKFDRKVTGIHYTAGTNAISGLSFFNRTDARHNRHDYLRSDYVFCPGEAVGTLTQLGLCEPAYGALAGVSLVLNIPLSAEQQAFYETFNRYMGIFNISSTVCQLRMKNNKMFIGIAGTRAYYSDQIPDINQVFPQKSNLLQLNMINSLFPDLISLAIGRDTRAQVLEMTDLNDLEKLGIAKRWVGRRAIAYDGFPALGEIYNQNGKVENGFCATDFGSGGVSDAPMAARISRSSLYCHAEHRTQLEQEALRYGQSNRK